MRSFPGPAALFPLIILAAALAIGGCAHEPGRKPAAAEELTIRKVWEVPGLTKDKLFDAANSWVGGSFSNDVDVIQYANRREGVVVGKTFIPYQQPDYIGLKDRFDLRFTIMVEVKDNKVRTTFTNLHLFSLKSIGTIYESDIKIIRSRLHKQVEDWIGSLTVGEKDKDW